MLNTNIHNTSRNNVSKTVLMIEFVTVNQPMCTKTASIQSKTIKLGHLLQ